MNQLGGLLPIAPGDAALTRKDLEAAGYRSESALQIYYGLRVVLCVVLLATSFLLRQRITENPVLRVVLPIGSALLGFALPSFLLQRRSRSWLVTNLGRAFAWSTLTNCSPKLLRQASWRTSRL